MNYQVLARKYRPQCFADVAGQQHVTVTLMNALEQERVAHGYIFSGHRGIGKTTVARILAMALNCRNGIGSQVRPTAEPCSVCESCTEIREGNSVDVIEIDAATNRGIDEIRELRDAARYRPARDRYKIYILDEAHQITDAAFNALLKTLEEPPEHIVFMMATTQPEDIPQTVRSRCQHFSFHAVKLNDILVELRSIASRESVDASESALNIIAEAGDGSVRDALSVMDQAIASAPHIGGVARLDMSQIREMLGTVSNAVFERMLESVDAGQTTTLMFTANELMDAGNSPAQLARQFVRYLRNVIFAKIANISSEDGASASMDWLQISVEERRRAARSALPFTEEELTRFLQVMLRTFDEVGYRQEPRLHFELGLLKLLHLRRLLPVEELLSQLPKTGSWKTPDLTKTARHVTPVVSPAAPTQPATVRDSGPANEANTSPFQADQRRKSANVFETGVSRESSPLSVSPEVSKVAADETQLRAVQGGDEISTAGPIMTNREEVVSVQPQRAASINDSIEDLPLRNVIDLSRVSAAAVEVQPPADANRLRAQALEILGAAKDQGSAVDALSESEWSINESTLRAQTQLSKTMLNLVVNIETHRLMRIMLAAETSGLRFEALPMSPVRQRAHANTAPKVAKAGSVEDRAQQHPVVQEAQRLFNAEIRNVIDLSGK